MSARNKKPPVNFRGSAGGHHDAKADKCLPTKRANCNTEPTHEQVLKTIQSRISQTNWLLQQLVDVGKVTTIEAYKQGILSPSACIASLRKKGHSIRTEKDWNCNGMAVYVLEKSGDRS